MQARRAEEPKSTRMVGPRRMGCYLKIYLAGRRLFPARRQPKRLRVYCDSDYAGDPITKTLSSGMAILWGPHLMRHDCAAQSTVNLSSGET
eukprot:6223551-Pyramimonas_sp.AAC.1